MRQGVELYRQTTNLKNGPQPDISDLFANQGAPKRDLKPALKPAAEAEPEPDSKYRKVAKFLILIGSEQAAEILAELDPEQVEEILKEIAITKVIKPEEGQIILEEFKTLFSKPYNFSGVSKGGVETARRILYAAKGPEKGEEILNRAIPASKEKLFSFLEEFTPDQVNMLLKTESAQTAALLLSRLPSKFSAEVLSKLPSDKKPEILKRIAYQREISPEVLEQVSAALKEKARHIAGSSGDIQIDGMQTLAAILKQGDYAFGDKIIGELENANPQIGKELKEKIYTLDDVIYTVDRPIQDKLAAMSNQDIAILIKGRGKEFSDKILTCVSINRRQQIREESEILGAVPKRDCDAIAGEFLAWFRTAREKGDIVLYSDRDVVV